MIRYSATIALCCILCLPACGKSDQSERQKSSAKATADNSEQLRRTGNYEDLVELFQEVVAWRLYYPGQPQGQREQVDDIAGYSPDHIAELRKQMRNMQDRLQRIDIQDWSIPQKVDYLTVRAELDQQEFILRVTRPWARDPVFYVSALLETAFTEIPAHGQELLRLQQNLRAVPSLLEQAKRNLTDVAADNATLAIRSLTTSDGVENNYPYREIPPAGIIGWYDDLLKRADDQPIIKPDISAALASIRDFHDWLVDNRDAMNGLNGVGKEAFDWFIRNAMLIPHTSDELLVLAQREVDRLWAFYALERHRNRALPEIELPASREEYRRRLAETDELIRTWLVEDEIITIPEYVPRDWREMGYNVPWIERDAGPNFWEQMQFRDPATDHLHAVIPGHRFDTIVSTQVDNPIRSQIDFGARREGWAVYLQEGMMRAGLLEARPRTRELIYIFSIFQATRTVGTILNQQNKMTAAQAAKFWLEITPMLDPNVARKYAYLRPAPGHGLQYTIGAMQIYDLLAARKRELRDNFVLEDFHDAIMSKGKIPVALIQYEMTGDEGIVDDFWNRKPLDIFLAEQQARE